jgi:hypothetical protein
MTDHIDCAQQCDIPDGVQLTEVPRPRHAWSDILNCPNEGCERSFMVAPAYNAGPTVAECAADDRRWWGGEKTGETP